MVECLCSINKLGDNMIVDLNKDTSCIGCGNKGKMFDAKWYCGIDFETRHGACKKKKKINNIPKEST